MEYNTSELCDLFADSVDVVDPIFASFGGRYSFGGEITTIKCFEDRGLIDRVLAQPGAGKVLLIDGGGSSRRALFDASSAQVAIDNDWEGVVIYGSVREVDSLAELDIGVLAVAAIPVNAECESKTCPLILVALRFYQKIICMLIARALFSLLSR